ncbi:FxsA family protein [Tautonia marina]|uniref:FxsA family protein n=1 Tax=Tautonia marina TaxID=2653855 RepID=UPI0012607A9B|nr:FxsA family protein [Tautonia marina]
MFVRLLLLLTIVPIVELFVLLAVHGAITERYNFQTGLLVTVGGILATGILGASLARSQGVGVIRELQQSIARGQFPARSLIDGAMILAGGAMLLTPGFLTDLVGLSLLIPVTRNLYRRMLNSWFLRSIQRGETRVRFHSQFAPGPERFEREPGAFRGPVIDVTPEDRD